MEARVVSMMWRMIGTIFGVSTVLGAAACDVDELGDEELALRDLEWNGLRLNGLRLNGLRLNGLRLNGLRLNGDAGSTDYVEITEIDPKGGGEVTAAWLASSELYVQTDAGATLSGAALEKTRIELDVQGDGRGKHEKVLQFVGYQALAPGSDVAMYQVEVKDSGWQPLCEGGTEAIVLAGVWDPETGARVEDAPADAVTFACRGAALAKCVEFGYRPWASVDGVSLRDHHQACTRMVRADYCGDGVAHTTDGTPIHVLDQRGIETYDPAASYVVEAEWGPDGATCLNAGNTRHAGQAIGCEIPACGAAFASGGLIQSGKVLPGA
jgi:hypothetical protein